MKSCWTFRNQLSHLCQQYSMNEMQDVKHAGDAAYTDRSALYVMHFIH